MDFNEVFSLNIGGNTVNIGTINYKRLQIYRLMIKLDMKLTQYPLNLQ